MTQKRISVMVTVPCGRHWLHQTVAAVLLQLQLDGRYDLNISFPSFKPYENYAHTAIVRLLNGDWDFWLSIDDDNPPTSNPLDLVELDLDVVNLPTPIYGGPGKDNDPDGSHKGQRPVFYNSFQKKPGTDGYWESRDHEGLVEVDAIGAGCFLAARRVFEDPRMQTGCFARPVNPDGTVERGADIAFSERARAAGFRLWTHWDYPCDQFSEISMHEMTRAWYEGVTKNGGSLDG